jgi:hypothetical protein
MRVFNRFCAGCVGLASVLLQFGAVGAIEPVTEDYVMRFAQDASFIVVIEYVDSTSSKIEGQRTFHRDQPFQAGQGVTIDLGAMSLNLYGLSACPSDASIDVASYTGPCSGMVTHYINSQLSLSPLVVCRVFTKYAEDALQDASCDHVFAALGERVLLNFDAVLVQVGAVTLTRGENGAPFRPDLVADEDLAKGKQTGLWNPAAVHLAGLK